MDPFCCRPLDTLQHGAPGVQARLVLCLSIWVHGPEQESIPLWDDMRQGDDICTTWKGVALTVGW